MGYGESFIAIWNATRHYSLIMKTAFSCNASLEGSLYLPYIHWDDIIHQHPVVDFQALRLTSGRDFNQFVNPLLDLSKVAYFLTLGQRYGPEIFLKASVSVGMYDYQCGITAANFDIVPVTADSTPSEQEPEYYYRPRRNMVGRLQDIGGKGLLF